MLHAIYVVYKNHEEHSNRPQHIYQSNLTGSFLDILVLFGKFVCISIYGLVCQKLS